jgi:cytochrome P450
VGEALDFLRDPFTFQLERTRKHGAVWKTRILGSTVVFFSGPKAFSFFLDPQNFTRENGSPPHMQELLHPDAVPFLDGQRHRTRKRLLLCAFEKEALESYLPKLERLIGRYLARAAERPEVELSRELTKLSFDIANVLFAAADPERHDAERAADFDVMVRGMFAPPVKLPFTAYGKALGARDRLRAYIKDAVAQKSGEGTALGVLKNARGPDGEKLSTAEIEIELLHFFTAAHAGIAAALAWLVVSLADHPEIRSKVQAEVDAAPQLDDHDGLRRLGYTNAVASEVRRRFPIAPSTFFGVARKDLEFDGMRIERGWKAAGAIWPTLNDKRVFDDPERFAPRRFEGGGGGALPDNAFVPQGGGAPDGHRCPGESFTTLVMPLFAALLLRDYDFELPPQDLSPGPGGLGPLPKDGLRARLRRKEPT